jgi:hypothetical protein
MMAMHKDQHKVDNIEKQKRWENYYGEKNSLPELDY